MGYKYFHIIIYLFLLFILFVPTNAILDNKQLKNFDFSDFGHCVIKLKRISENFNLIDIVGTIVQTNIQSR